ncbi:tyrosine-protein kinase hopscotch isoform X1 [Bombyx mandarina]|uniref:non-specific protein-tyrosine kinase n=1 Tax=Bombyx mandarina TaxID=7092 RepID=A0A6J2JS54_BOMMA|nr:tyrosine-protein kinase hopscotch isoform X1 [Bombyx mandarina]
MATVEDIVKVAVVTNRTPNNVRCTSTLTAEELCIILCKKYNIPPLTRTLFALRVKGTDYFLKDNCKVLSGSRDYELRIRFKVPRLSLLITLDETTYDYYFQQARNDVNENKIPEIKYPEHKQELLGLGITDMTRAIAEERLPLNDVIRNYKKYIPKEIAKRHGPFPKKYAIDYLPQLSSVGHNVNYVKNLYLQQLYALAPNYLAEEYDNVLWQNGSEMTPVRVMVAPFHPHHPGIRLYNTLKREWFYVCSVEELIYLTRNGDSSVEVSRRGTPVFLKFKSEDQLSSFISVCDGYYRLTVKWTFNLSKDDETPSLKELQRIKCHGPVGGAFSYRKLEEKRGKKHGCYILRQCQDEYNVYYLDVCTKTSTTETYRIEFKGHCYIFSTEEYFSIERLVSCHQNPEGRIYLNECIPPSEYDKSQLLLCGEPVKRGVRIDQAELQEILRDNKSPRCLPNKDILLYTGSEKTGSENITATYKALWRLDETKKLLVAFKTLQRERANDYLKDFVDLASKWACIQSSSIVRLYGVTLSSPTAMVLEYLPYGPFDDYLRENGDRITPLHLKKVAAGLARALWDLSEAGVVHGYIRCRKLLLAVLDADRIQVKLSGPTLRQYTQQDVHWMPVEFFADMNLAKRSVIGDIWAFATTLWEVFSYGQLPTETNPVLTVRSYEMGDRLLRPVRCPAEVWALVRQCWHADPLRPQEIMRDMNHMLYREYVPVHQYEEPKISLDHIEHAETVSSDRFIPSELSDAGSNKSLISDNSVPSMNGTMSDQYDNPFADNKSSNSLDSMAALMYGLPNEVSSARSTSSAGGAATLGLDDALHDCDAWASPRLMESIVSQGKTYLVTLTKKIGSGNYGHVFKGWMERDNQESHRKEVAIKKLTRQASERNGTLYEDFKNELEIMKSLQHINIVEILGYAWDQGPEVLIVMEYLEEGSLNYYLKFQGEKLRISHLLKYCKDIATGMDHVSAKNVVHRDLATRNILVVNKYHVKISDFGLARIIPKEENTYRLKTERLLPINWYAPESAVEPWHFSTKSDVWSYGVTAWEIFTRARQEVPKFDVDRPRERASCFQIPEECPSEIFRYLMKECWALDPNLRPRFIDLIHTCKRFIAEYQ